MLRYYKKAPVGARKGKPSWCVVSHTTHKVLSCYPSKSAGEKALKRISRFSKS